MTILRSQRSLCVIGLLVLAVGSIPSKGQGHRPIVPLPPAELLAFLPSAPKDWMVTESTAKNFFLAWLCAQATREFQHPSPAPPPPGAPPPPPYITRVRIMDTGYYPSFNGDFENFRIGKYSNAESLLTQGMPSRRITISPTRERLRISVRGRFIVEIETDNQPPDSGKNWLQFVDFRRVAGIADSSSSELPKPIVIQNIDELHPTKNSSSQLNWGGSTNPAETER